MELFLTRVVFLGFAGYFIYGVGYSICTGTYFGRNWYDMAGVERPDSVGIRSFKKMYLKAFSEKNIDSLPKYVFK